MPGLLDAGGCRRQPPPCKAGQSCPGDVGAGAVLTLRARAACIPPWSAPTPFPQQHVSLPPRSNFLSIVPVAATTGPQRRAMRLTASLHAPPRTYPTRAVPTFCSSQKNLGAATSPVHSQNRWGPGMAGPARGTHSGFRAQRSAALQEGSSETECTGVLDGHVAAALWETISGTESSPIQQGEENCEKQARAEARHVRMRNKGFSRAGDQPLGTAQAPAATRCNEVAAAPGSMLGSCRRVLLGWPNQCPASTAPMPP